MKEAIALVEEMGRQHKIEKDQLRLKLLVKDIEVFGLEAEVRGLKHVIKEHEAELDAVLEREETTHEEVMDLISEINRLEGIVIQQAKELRKTPFNLK